MIQYSPSLRCCTRAIHFNVGGYWVPAYAGMTARVVVARRPSRPMTSRRAAVGADTGELDHRRFRREAGGAGGRGQRRSDVDRGGLADGAAALADQEHHELAGGVIVHT